MSNIDTGPEKAVSQRADEAGSKGDIEAFGGFLHQLLLPCLGPEVMALAKSRRKWPKGRGI